MSFGGELIERVLHQRDDVLVDLVDVGVWPEALVQVDRRQDLDGDLRRERDVTRNAPQRPTSGIAVGIARTRLCASW